MGRFKRWLKGDDSHTEKGGGRSGGGGGGGESGPPSSQTQQVLKPKTQHEKEIIWAAQDSACRQAYSELTSEEKALLRNTNHTTQHELFASLQQGNENHRSQSHFRKGAEKMHPYLKNTKAVIGLGANFGAFDATGTVGLALGLASSAVSDAQLLKMTDKRKQIGVHICGLCQEFDEDVAKFIGKIPEVEKYDELVRKSGETKILWETLVKVHKSMFHFHLTALRTLESKSFLFDIMKHHEDVREAVEAVVGNADQMFTVVGIETHIQVVVQARHQRITELLGRERENRLVFRPVQRAEGSSEWIRSTTEFGSWIDATTSDTQILTMFGDMGCGKTMVCTYVADMLERDSELVLRYYCKDEKARDKVANLYWSLIAQLLVCIPDLDIPFLEFVEASQARDPQKEFQQPKDLRDCFLKLLRRASRKVFIVLDALDECDKESWEELKVFITGLSKLDSHCRVFASSRHDKKIKASIPGQKFDMVLSNDEATFIARHFVTKEYFQGECGTTFTEKDQQRMISKVSSKAEGSATWMRMVLAYLDTLWSDDILCPNVDKLLKDMEASPHDKMKDKLEKLASKLYKRCCEKESVSGRVQPVLEFLAFAARPVTMRELSSYALFYFQGEKELSTVEETKGTHVEAYLRVIDLIRPFIHTDGKPDSIVRLVHKSVRDLIIQKDPKLWATSNTTAEISEKRGTQIHGQLASTCLRYIQHPEFNKETRISERRKEEFFNYASASWPSHIYIFSNVTPEQLCNFISICKPGSSLLQNWIREYRDPSNSAFVKGVFLSEFSNLDPLVIAVQFQLDLLAEVLLNSSDIFKRGFRPSSAETSIETSLRTGRFGLAKKIFDTSGKNLRKLTFFKTLMVIYNPGTAFWGSANEKILEEMDPKQKEDCEMEEIKRKTREVGWDKFFDEIIPTLLPELVKWGPEALCAAVASSCHAVVRKLFKLADQNPKLDKSLLEDHGRKGQHQSVGLAAELGDVDMWRLLRKRRGIEKHVRHIGPNGQTVLHAAAEQVHSSQWHLELLKELVDAFPEGESILDNKGRHFRECLRQEEKVEV